MSAIYLLARKTPTAVDDGDAATGSTSDGEEVWMISDSALRYSEPLRTQSSR
ncbi:hypothetical protein I3760_06G163500 [Carya illinoinensis]|nr:hypothetical protein I3760_06G163500 [Carya illinoinensis]